MANWGPISSRVISGAPLTQPKIPSASENGGKLETPKPTQANPQVKNLKFSLGALEVLSIPSVTYIHSLLFIVESQDEYRQILYIFGIVIITWDTRQFLIPTNSHFPIFPLPCSWDLSWTRFFLPELSQGTKVNIGSFHKVELLQSDQPR